MPWRHGYTRLALATGAIVAGLGCGGSTSAGSGNPAQGQATVNGTVPTMAPHYSATAYAWGLYTPFGTQITIALDNLVGVADICGLVNSNVNPANSHLFLLVLHSRTEAVEPGRYSVGATLQADYLDENANCMPGPETSATGGTAEVVRADTSFEGSFQVTFPTGEMQGSFNAPTCDSPEGSMMSDAGTTCIQYPACTPQAVGGKPCMD